MLRYSLALALVVVLIGPSKGEKRILSDSALLLVCLCSRLPVALSNEREGKHAIA